MSALSSHSHGPVFSSLLRFSIETCPFSCISIRNEGKTGRAIGRIWLANYHSEMPGPGLDPAVVAQVGVFATQTYNTRKNSAIFVRLIVELLGLMVVLFYGGTTIRSSTIQREHKLGHISANPWVLDFALVLGVTKFGLQGMLLGPFLVAIGATVWDALVEAQVAEQDLGNSINASSLYKSPDPADPWGIDSSIKHHHGAGGGDELGASGGSKRSLHSQPRDRLQRSPGGPGSVRRLFSPSKGDPIGAGPRAGGKRPSPIMDLNDEGSGPRAVRAGSAGRLQRQGSVVGRPSSRGES